MRDTEFRQGQRSGSCRFSVSCILTIAFALLIPLKAYTEDRNLRSLIDEALSNNHEILVSEARLRASEFRIPQAASLPDPMFMFGYQNEGFRRYTYGEMADAQWMFSASQMFPFPGKLSLKKEMARGDSGNFRASLEAVKLRTVARVKELYYDLFLSYRNLDIIRDRTALFSRIEDAALARYSSGMGSQQEVLMAQTEKYMLLEKEEMQKQRIQSVEAMLNNTIGRDAHHPIGRPEEPPSSQLVCSERELLQAAFERSPEVKSKEQMISVAETKVLMAEKEYYPDFTLNAGYFRRGGDFEDMWSLTTTINIPLFYRTKQRQAVNEAEAFLVEAQHELDATKFMISSAMRDTCSMLNTAERLMELYKGGLIPKTFQDFESGLAGYMTGRVEAMTVITRTKALLDYESLYWVQFVEREKAIARLESITGKYPEAEGYKK